MSAEKHIILTRTRKFAHRLRLPLRGRATRQARVVFFARVPEPEMLRTVHFYRADIEALEAVGLLVEPVNRLRRVPLRADAYFVWWWTHALPIAVLGRLTRRPVFITGTMHWDAGPAEGGFAYRPFLQRAVIALSARLASKNLCVTIRELELMREGLPGCEFAYYPHAVESTPAPDLRATPRIERLIADLKDSMVVLNISWSEARNLRRKCVFEVIAGFEILADSVGDVQLILCGNHGDGVPALQARVRSSRHRERIHFLGQVTNEERARLYALADVMASPSRYEGFGVAIAEAAAAGVAVLTSPVGAVPEVLGSGAQLCDGTDPDDVARGLKLLTGDHDYRIRLAAAGRSAVSRFSQEQKVNRTRELLSTYVPIR